MNPRTVQEHAASVVTVHDRLLAEAVRMHERDGAAPVDHPAAEVAAREKGGDFEQRIITRARSLPIADSLRQSLHQINAVVAWLVVFGGVLAAVAGAATARATLGIDERGMTNFFWVLGGVLGVQSIALLAWLILFVATYRVGRSASGQPRRGSAVSLGSILIGVAQWIARRINQSSQQTAAVQAAGRVSGSGTIGRWSLSAITHGLWLAFNVGCLLMIMALLSARQYTFVWETTILTERHYVQLTRAIAALPEAVGFDVPTEQQIIASQRSDDSLQAGSAREAWSSLLVASVVLYGFGPRLLLLGLSLSRRRAAARRYRLDTTLPGFARLEARLADIVPHITEPTEPESERPPAERDGQTAVAPDRPLGPIAIVGLELNQVDLPWPPRMASVHWRDLGVLEGRDDQHRTVRELSTASTEPAALVIVCDLTTTPDRGLARLLQQLCSAITRPPLVLLSGGHALRTRGADSEHVEQRVADWRKLAANAGVPEQRVLEMDLEHLTDVGELRLAGLLEVEDQAESPLIQRRIEDAFAQIAEHVQRWQRQGATEIDTAQQAELHRAVGLVYRDDAHQWRDLLRAAPSMSGDVASQLKRSAQRAVDLLPDRLRRSPRWLAAGAMSGALGCVAAATLLSPIAIAALPTWSVIGAAIAAAVQPSGSRDDSAQSQAASADYGDAVRSAALFALLLELQNRDEAVITRILDGVIEDEVPTPIADASTARAWLDDLRHRFDLVAAEVLR